MQACLLPAPKGVTCANYARCVNQILQNLSNMQVSILSLFWFSYFSSVFIHFNTCSSIVCFMFHILILILCGLKLWLRIPLEKSDDDDGNRSPNSMVSNCCMIA